MSRRWFRPMTLWIWCQVFGSTHQQDVQIWIIYMQFIWRVRGSAGSDLFQLCCVCLAVKIMTKLILIFYWTCGTNSRSFWIIEKFLTLECMIKRQHTAHAQQELEKSWEISFFNSWGWHSNWIMFVLLVEDAFLFRTWFVDGWCSARLVVSTGRLDSARLRKALDELQARHVRLRAKLVISKWSGKARGWEGMRYWVWPSVAVARDWTLRW